MKLSCADAVEILAQIHAENVRFIESLKREKD